MSLCDVCFVCACVCVRARACVSVRNQRVFQELHTRSGNDNLADRQKGLIIKR